MCTGTRGGSETSLNTVVHENVEVYYLNLYVTFFFEIFLKFFQKLASAYNFYKLYKSKFVKFVKSRFSLGLDAAENTHHIKKILK